MKPLKRDELEELIFGKESVRFTQDSPILPDVWIEYGRKPNEAIDLLLTPHREATAAELSHALRKRLKEERNRPRWRERHPEAKPARLAYNQSTVAACLSFDELIRVVLPLSRWWTDWVCKPSDGGAALFETPSGRERLVEALAAPPGHEERRGISPDLLWLIPIIARILWAQKAEPSEPESRATRMPKSLEEHRRDVEDVADLLLDPLPLDGDTHPLWSVSRNREASTAIWRSTLAVKADAARRLFSLSCSQLCWAIVDSGVDAQHPAFRVRDKDNPPIPLAAGDWSAQTRVVATFDFTRIRFLLSLDEDGDEIKRYASDLRTLIQEKPDDPRVPEWRRQAELFEDLTSGDMATVERVNEFRDRLSRGRAIDWDLISPFLQVPHDANYQRPRNDHGTHVAGILAAEWLTSDPEKPDEDLVGVCPDIKLYDLRVLDGAGKGDEFSVIAALQFIRHLNSHKDEVVIHGVNTSLSMTHDVANYACGRTPVCDECERLVAAGVVVVAAAGNQGYIQYLTPKGEAAEGYRSISITDPGNADGVITVGATHRFQPHTYGVSYFSSRGPTGDGRLKPDLVAPGEKIKAPVPGGLSKSMDGTSMAAPHVSGAAALLMARHRELVGQPGRIKQILCKTATDLGRERYFQGSGMLDTLRALQAV